ncbi:NrsF family protein [Neorhizobium sp. DT-125]|uniref:NrsF family protein n=1 Tax=Neorhizobium sp. DT-125 TaxID=3396163 RepID=UPI003F1CD32C
MRKTDDIIESLVGELKPVPRHALQRRFALGVLPALAVSLVLMLTVAGLRPDLSQALSLPVFWIKSAYNALLAIAAFLAVYHLARPEGSQGRFFAAAAAIFAAMAVVAAIQLLLSPAETYPVLILGSSALHCPFLIFAFALPVLAGNAWVLRRAAPTNLRLTGFIAGLAAGAAGAWVYSWFCTENGMPFVLIWYSLGILLTGALGSLLGPRLLRW